MLRAYWKRFAELVTGFASKYRGDVFYRTGWNVVALQVGFVVALLAIVWISYSLLYGGVIERLLEAVSNAIATGSSFDGAGLYADLEYERQKYLLLAGTGILSAAVLFSWLITRIALRPTKNALESQKRFISNVAHELRTPLSIIKTNTEVHMLDSTISADSRVVDESNLEELDRISDIINNLLSLNALIRPERMVFADLEVGPVIARSVEVLAKFAATKRIRIELETVSSASVRANASALEQIVTNLLKNAIAYTPAGGEVRISAEPDFFDGSLTLTVKDNGPGIEEKDLAHVFEPFYRGDRARSRRVGGGSGLGLAIVSELVKLLKGRIRLDSAPGMGTTVTVTFPLSRQRPGTPLNQDDFHPSFIKRDR